MTALDMFRLIASEFATVSDADVSKWLEVAGQRVSESVFGNLYLQALAYLAAHLMKMQAMALANSKSGLNGNVKREKNGDLEVEYVGQFNTDANANYYMTPYGMMFISLRRQRVFPVMNRM